MQGQGGALPGVEKVLASEQGQVLNQTSAWWMHSTQHIVPNALLAVPHPNVSVMRRCRVFPVEFVVRAYLTGRLPRWGGAVEHENGSL